MIDRAWLEIDAQALLNNYQQIQNRVGRSKVMAVVKDVFYGLGVDSVLTLQEHGVDFFATATISEALELRHAGIDKNILVLGYTHPSRFIELVQNDLHQTIISYDYGLKIETFHERIKTHLKINTGMNRLGVNYKEREKILDLYNRLEISGVFSHLLASDELTEKGRDVTKLQIQRMDEVVDFLESHNVDVGFTHLHNSYGCLNYGEYQYDYVRPGLIFVGCPDAKNFQNALTLKARVAMVKDIKKNEQIGYGAENTVPRDMRVATVTIGYGDGLERRLAETDFTPSIGGVACPFVGRMSMDQCVVDVSNVDNVKEGDVIEFLNNEHDVFKMAEALNTIPYEILTHMMSRLPRSNINEEL